MLPKGILFFFICSCIFHMSVQQLPSPGLPVHNYTRLTTGTTQWLVINMLYYQQTWVNFVNVYSNASTTFKVSVSNDQRVLTTPQSAYLPACSASPVGPSGTSGGQRFVCEPVDTFGGSYLQNVPYVVISYPTTPIVNVTADVIGFLLIEGQPNLIQQSIGSGAMNRSWAEFKTGFLADDNSFWIGNDAISFYMTTATCSLEIDIQAASNKKWYSVFYSSFLVAKEASNYTLTASGFSSNTSGMKDWMPSTTGMQFTTYDRDNDKYPNGNCAVLDGGGWWHNFCANIKINNKNGTGEGYAYGGLAEMAKTNNITQTRMIMKCGPPYFK